VGFVLMTGGASPAQAEPGTLGWLRVSPATGTVDTPIDVLSQAQCPAGESVVVAIDGPRIPSKGDLGFIVGNTAISALPVTDTQQLYVPLSLTIGDWFGRNVPRAKPVGTYTLTLTCRDRLRSSEVFGSYTARISIAKDGTYRALGEASRPLGIQVGAADPVSGGAVPSPSTPGVTGGSGAAPSTTPQGVVPSQAADPRASSSLAPTEPAVEAQAGPSAPVATDAGATGPGPLPIALLGVAVAIVAGVVVANRRRAGDGPRHSAPGS
jgi:hypothetical protein